MRSNWRSDFEDTRSKWGRKCDNCFSAHIREKCIDSCKKNQDLWWPELHGACFVQYSAAKMRTFRDNRATIFEAVYALRGYDDDDDDDEMMITIATRCAQTTQPSPRLLYCRTEHGCIARSCAVAPSNEWQYIVQSPILVTLTEVEKWP